ncbi:MAG: anti-sigma-factor antagonist (STAS) and sugar transfersase [Cyanobium sp. CACIAM 14]|nr:MAG: anti-sigma-factor antagonist (STAS) and sugar transfersase [Cyanobium sp. CACIAM 14]
MSDALPSSQHLERTQLPTGALLVRLPERLTVREAVPFREAFESLLRDDPATVILDCAGLTLIDSSGIGALVGALKAGRHTGIPLEAWSVGGQVRLALELAGLERILPIEPRTEALPARSDQRPTARPPLTHPSVRCRPKRLLDVVGALVGLAITAVLFLPIVLAIRLDSPGPILFGQVRCGWMGRRFRLWKFRSMVSNAEALRASVPNQASGAIFKNDADPRITRVGRLLRRTSLDELPQFWNVLVGDMSLIGTRPPTPDEVERYAIPSWQRFDVRPGMSGEWQVSGRSSIRDFEDVIALDLRYQERWSFLYDLKLILRTLRVIFSRESGAA